MRRRGRPRSAMSVELTGLMRRVAQEQVRRVGIAAWTPTIGDLPFPTCSGRSVASLISKIVEIKGETPIATMQTLWRGVVVDLGYHPHAVRAPWSVRPVRAWAPLPLTSEQAQAAFLRLLPLVQRPTHPRAAGLDLDSRWEEVRALVRARYGRWMRTHGIEMADAEQEVYFGLLRRQEGRSAYDPTRSGWSVYVTLVAGSVLSHLVERTTRRGAKEQAWSHDAEDVLLSRVTDSPEEALVALIDRGRARGERQDVQEMQRRPTTRRRRTDAPPATDSTPRPSGV